MTLDTAAFRHFGVRAAFVSVLLVAWVSASEAGERWRDLDVADSSAECPVKYDREDYDHDRPTLLPLLKDTTSGAIFSPYMLVTADGGGRACPVGHQALAVAQLLDGHAACAPALAKEVALHLREGSLDLQKRTGTFAAVAASSGQRRLGDRDAGPRTGVTSHRARLRPTW